MSGEDNEKRIKENQRALEADDAEDAANARLFDPRELLKTARSIRQKRLPGLGMVNYGVLSFDEMLEIGLITDKNERTKTTLWMMLRKAYSDVKKEDIGKYPGSKVLHLLELLGDTGDFLPPELKPKSSKAGSKLTRTRK